MIPRKKKPAPAGTVESVRLQKKWFGRHRMRPYPDENTFIDGRSSDLQLQILHMARRYYGNASRPNIRVRDVVAARLPEGASRAERRRERSVVSRSFRSLVRREFLKPANGPGEYNLTRFGWAPPRYEQGVYENRPVSSVGTSLFSSSELEALGFENKQQYSDDAARRDEIESSTRYQILQYREKGIADENIARWLKVKPEELDALVAGGQ